MDLECNDSYNAVVTQPLRQHQSGVQERPRRALITRPAFVALFVVFAVLLLQHSGDPWQYVHDDNGAFYSAIARAHLMRGLASTRGQDFVVLRDNGELRPYLHHPPLLGLYLAAVFALTRNDSPVVARLALIAVHAVSLVVFLAVACALLPTNTRAQLWAGFVFAITPMSVYFGKMPNHEPLSLCFLLVGFYAYLRHVRAMRPHSPYLYLGALAWLLAGFSSWHSFRKGKSGRPIRRRYVNQPANASYRPSHVL